MDGENRGEHDRAVVRALQSLAATTSPTAAERQRIRDRILLALDDAAEEDLPSAQTSSPTVGTHDDVPAPRDAGQPAVATGVADDAGRSPTAGPAAERTANPVADRSPARPAGLPPATDPANGPTAEHTSAKPAASRSTDPAIGPTDTPAASQSTTERAATDPADTPAAERTAARPASRRSANDRAAAGTATDPADTSAAKHTAARPVARRSAAIGPAARRGGVRDQVRPRSPQPGQRGVPSGSQRGEGGPRGVLAGLRGRFAVAAVAVLALVGSLAGMSVLLARDALPGDTLYGVKRTAEAAELGLTFGDEPKALKHLEFAASRVSEIETLARRYPNPADAPVGSYLTALTDFDNDATAGSRQLITLATSADGRLLESLREWSTQQAARLQAVADRLPEAARNRQAATRGLLERITARTDALLARMDCYQITSGSFDDIGALPATGQCEDNLAPTSGNTAPPSVPATPDNSRPATGPETASDPIPPAGQTPEIPPVPVPGATATVPPTTRPSTPSTSTPEAPPILELPPLLPGLPTLSIG